MIALGTGHSGATHANWNWQLWSSQPQGQCCTQEACMHQAREKNGVAWQSPCRSPWARADGQGGEFGKEVPWPTP